MPDGRRPSDDRSAIVIVTRFAPSPTGPLHLGHAYSALTIQSLAGDGRVHLRIEDADSARSRPEYAAQIVEDLTWLGFAWAGEPENQSDNRVAHDAALHALGERGLTYPCSCTRRDIIEAGAAIGRMGMVYPGTCRGRPLSDECAGDAIRLDLRRALAEIGPLPAFAEFGPLNAGTHRLDVSDLVAGMGDPVLRRRESGDIAYDLACTHDDAAIGVTHVIRGEDLWHNTALHVLIQTVMGWPVPSYFHHALVRDGNGRRLAKVDRSKAIARYREEGLNAGDLRALLPPLPISRWAT